MSHSSVYRLIDYFPVGTCCRNDVILTLIDAMSSYHTDFNMTPFQCCVPAGNNFLPFLQGVIILLPVTDS